MAGADRKSHFALPIFMNTLNLKALIVGGGPVGRRKARVLIAAGAAVRVVALEPPPDDLRNERLQWLTEPYRSDHLADARLVFTAAPTAVCEQVQKDAASRGLLVCRADRSDCGDFVMPATIVRGNLRIAVATNRASPIVARRIRERLERDFDETFGEWVQLLDGWRIKAGSGSWDQPTGRQEFLERIADWNWLDRFRLDGEAAVNREYAALAAELGLRTTVV
jgi:precorrin-2 dehydrogenase / sirohydrochlorin ferrochelatase